MFIMQRCSGGVTKAEAAGLKCGPAKHGLRLFAHIELQRRQIRVDNGFQRGRHSGSDSRAAPGLW